jgi:predicted phosphodiesterase
MHQQQQNKSEVWGKAESLFARDNSYDTFTSRYPKRSWTAYRKHRMRVYHQSSWRNAAQQLATESREVRGEHPYEERYIEQQHVSVTPPSAPVGASSLVEIARDRLRLVHSRAEDKTFYEAKGESLAAFDGIVASLQALPAPRPYAPTVIKSRNQRRKRTMVLLYSDSHCGLRVDSESLGGLEGFNIDVWAARHDILRDAVIEAQDMFNVDELAVFDLGDVMDGATIFKGHAYHIDKSIPEQIVLSGNRIAEDTSAFASVFPKMMRCVVYGNHGRSGSYGENPYSSNYEYTVYEMAKGYCRNMKNVDWYMSKSWFQMVDILGTTFCLVHGDDIKSYGANLAAGARRTKQMYMSMLNMPFDYLCAGHHHQQLADDHTLANGSFVFASEFTAKNLASVGLPKQKIFIVEEDKGVTWKHDVPLASWSDLRNVPIIGR